MAVENTLTPVLVPRYGPADACHDRSTDRDVGDEMTVHDVDV